MKLMWSFGNPQPPGKARKKSKKVAKTRKKRKTKKSQKKSVPTSRGNMAKRKAKKPKKKYHAGHKPKHKRKKKKDKNPIKHKGYVGEGEARRKLGEVVTYRVKDIDELKNRNKTINKLEKMIMKLPLEKRVDMRQRIAKLRKGEAQKWLNHNMKAEDILAKWKSQGAEIHTEEYDLPRRRPGLFNVAKPDKRPLAGLGAAKKTRKKKSTKKAGTKVAKKTTKKKSTKKGTKKGSKKRTKKAASKRAKKAASKRTKKAAKKRTKKRAAKRTKKRGSKRGRKMYTHKHARSVLHFAKGATAHVSARKTKRTYKIKAKIKGKKGRKGHIRGSLRVSKKGILSGFLKLTNPIFKGNPMIKDYTGLDNKDLRILISGAVAAPLMNALTTKVAGVQVATDMLTRYFPVKYRASVANLVIGVAAYALAKQNWMPKKAQPVLAMAGEGLAAAAVFSGISNIVVDLLKAGNIPVSLNGVNYTPMGIMPQLNGINYSPMSGIEYTPMMGSSADFGSADYGGDGGYTEAHNRSSADFGAWQSADSEANVDADNSLSASMN